MEYEYLEEEDIKGIQNLGTTEEKLDRQLLLEIAAQLCAIEIQLHDLCAVIRSKEI